MTLLLSVLTLVVWQNSDRTVSGDPTQRRPNVLFILADDPGWQDLSVEGSTFYESPKFGQQKIQTRKQVLSALEARTAGCLRSDDSPDTWWG